MAPETERHGAFVSSDEMLRSINSLTIVVAENNVQMKAILDELREVKRDVEKHDTEIGDMKVKIYTMSGVIGIGVSVATSWITGQVNG